jgi:hypothetical protein
MINKRLLIKNLLSHSDENTFFEKKEYIDLISEKGKGKFLKHICALSNSNPQNNSYIIIGIADKTNEIKGINYIDDSYIQNLVNGILYNPPAVNFENVVFPDLPKEKSIGLLTIHPLEHTTSFRKKIGGIHSGSSFHRIGSLSVPYDSNFNVNPQNSNVVSEIEKYSSLSFKGLLDDVFDFFKLWNYSEYQAQYHVFKDQFVICWAGYRTTWGKIPILSEVDIRLINEASRIYYSGTQYVNVEIDDSELRAIEYKVLGFDDDYNLYPFEEKKITFHDNGQFHITTEYIFNPPHYEKPIIVDLYKRAKAFEKEILNGHKIDSEEFNFYDGLANFFLICYFNGIPTAKDDLLNSSKYLDGSAAEWRTECIEVLEKYLKNGS